MTYNSPSPYNMQKHGTKLEISSSFSVTTRQQRRKALKILIQLLQIVLAAEKRYMDDIPDNHPDSSLYDDAGQTVGAMEEALEILGDAYY